MDSLAGENLLIKVPLFLLAAGKYWKGGFDVAAAYVADDAILNPSDLLAYYSILAGTGHTPPNGTYWTALPNLGAENIGSINAALGKKSWFYRVLTGDAIAGPAALTSGTLVIGKKYKIITFVALDDFTNVGAASNATGVIFDATGDTPTTWSNGSTLQEIVLTPGSKYIISSFSASDVFTNIGAAADATGIVFICTGDGVPTTWTHGSLLKEVDFDTSLSLASGLLTLELTAGDTSGLSGNQDFQFTLARTDSTFLGTLAQTDALLFRNAVTVNPPPPTTDIFAATSIRRVLTLPAICRAVL